MAKEKIQNAEPRTEIKGFALKMTHLYSNHPMLSPKRGHPTIKKGQAGLAELLGVSSTEISFYINGRNGRHEAEKLTKFEIDNIIQKIPIKEKTTFCRFS